MYIIYVHRGVQNYVHQDFSMIVTSTIYGDNDRNKHHKAINGQNLGKSFQNMNNECVHTLNEKIENFIHLT